MSRPALRVWLTEPERVVLWDVLVVYRVSRLARGVDDVAELAGWARAHGKRVAEAAP